ncbi:hypothetical protein HMPREF3034_00112 [Prevotella sp. DNF00663]|nr:hypothetical protein HMPREF3034_00112 [Prevotella sp. DNF00663]
MIVQYIITFLIITLALSFAFFRLYTTFKHANDKCYGCSGCAIHDQMLKKKKNCRVLSTSIEGKEKYKLVSKIGN